MWQRGRLRKDRRPLRKKADNKNREETCQAAIPPLRRQLCIVKRNPLHSDA